VSSSTVLDAELLLWLPAAPWPLGSLFGSFSPRGARSKGDQQPDGRVTHNQKLLNILGVDIRTLATRVLRARKTRKMQVSPWPLGDLSGQRLQKSPRCELVLHDCLSRLGLEFWQPFTASANACNSVGQADLPHVTLHGGLKCRSCSSCKRTNLSFAEPCCVRDYPN
jgi:hypothetical protein